MKPEDTATLPFVQVAERYWESLTRGPERPRALRSTRTILDRHLIPALGRLDVNRLEAADVERYRAGMLARGLSAKTINNHLSVLRAVLRFAEANTLVARTPCIENLEAATTPVAALSAEDCERLLRACDGELRAMVLLALRTGLRLGELRALRWSDVDLAGARLRVNSPAGLRETGARGRAREIPLGPKTVLVLSGLPRRGEWVFSGPDGSKLTHGACKWPLYRAALRAGLEPFGWDVLRCTFARELMARHVSPRSIQRLLGMRSAASLLRYAPRIDDPTPIIHLLDLKDRTRWAGIYRRAGASANRPTAPPRSTIFVLVPDDGRHRARLGLPSFGVPGVPMLARVACVQAAHQ